MIKHGTISGYTAKKCRCDACKEAKRLSDRAYYDRKGRMPKGNPVTIFGQTFKSQTEAAAHFGVSDSVISYHLVRYGDFSRFRKPAGGNKGGNRRAIRVGHQEWRSRKELAEYLGISTETIRGWLKRGSHERLVAAVMKADQKQRRAA